MNGEKARINNWLDSGSICAPFVLLCKKQGVSVALFSGRKMDYVAQPSWQENTRPPHVSRGILISTHVKSNPCLSWQSPKHGAFPEPPPIFLSGSSAAPCSVCVYTNIPTFNGENLKLRRAGNQWGSLGIPLEGWHSKLGVSFTTTREERQPRRGNSQSFPLQPHFRTCRWNPGHNGWMGLLLKKPLSQILAPGESCPRNTSWISGSSGQTWLGLSSCRAADVCPDGRWVLPELLLCSTGTCWN